MDFQWLEAQILSTFPRQSLFSHLVLHILPLSLWCCWEIVDIALLLSITQHVSLTPRATTISPCLAPGNTTDWRAVEIDLSPTQIN